MKLHLDSWGEIRLVSRIARRKIHQNLQAALSSIHLRHLEIFLLNNIYHSYWKFKA